MPCAMAVGGPSHRLDVLSAQRDRRQRACRVAGVDARLLDVLHHAADVHLGAVAQCVDVDLDGVLEESVDEDRVLGREFGGTSDVAAQRLVVVDDLHATSAEHVRRPHQDRVPDVGGDAAGLLEAGGHPESRRGQAGVLEHLAELAAILGQVDRLGAGADDRHTSVREPLRKTERRLTTELDDDADDTGTACARGGFGVVDLEHVLEGQGFEVQPVGGVVVGRHRLGVAVDHDGLEARPRSTSSRHARSCSRTRCPGRCGWDPTRG